MPARSWQAQGLFISRPLQDLILDHLFPPHKNATLLLITKLLHFYTSYGCLLLNAINPGLVNVNCNTEHVFFFFSLSYNKILCILFLILCYSINHS